jgi:hypothetical protein
MLTKHIDTEKLLEAVDLQLIAQTDLGKPASAGKSAMYRCPFHNEQHGHSLAVWKDGWYCFGKCATGGTAIDWVMKLHHLDFLTACKLLGGEPVLVSRSKRCAFAKAYNQVERVPALAEPPDAEWQAEAREVVAKAEWTLWNTPAGQQRALPWLKKRGLLDATLRAAHVGYIPGKRFHPYKHFAIPSGITLPRFVGDALWGINVRQAAGDPKYKQATSANLAGALYWAVGSQPGCCWGIVPGWPVLFLEGEFDCLIAWQEAAELCCPVTLGSQTNRLDPRWYPLLWSASATYLCYDNDAAGEEGAARLLEALPTAKRIHVPTGKDMNDFHLAAPDGVTRWIHELVEGEVQA